jgi:hypothetical protein
MLIQEEDESFGEHRESWQDLPSETWMKELQSSDPSTDCVLFAASQIWFGRYQWNLLPGKRLQDEFQRYRV